MARKSPRRPTGFLRLAVLANGSEVWRALIRTSDGKRPQRTLGLAWRRRSRPPEGYLTRAQAEARLQKILDGRDPTLIVVPRPGAAVLLSTAVAEFLDWIENDRKRKPSTIRDYRQENRRLIEEFGEAATLDDLTIDRIDEWRRKMLKEGRKARTINKRLIHLGSIFRQAMRVHGFPFNPVEGVVRQPDPASGDFNVLTPDEVLRVVGNAQSEQDAAIFTVAAFAGLRKGELRALRWKDVSWTSGVIFVRRNLPAGGDEGAPKSGKVRSVPLVDHAARALNLLSHRDHFMGDEDLVFCTEIGRPLNGDTLRDRFYDALNASGLGHLREKERPITFHDLRHSFGTLAVQVWPVPEVQGYMGHADIQTTMRYVHHVPRAQAAGELTALIEKRTETTAGCILGAPDQDTQTEAERETALASDETDGAGRTRTFDRRIMSPLL
jgi:integrase